MRLANGCKVPWGCDLDRPYALPMLGYRFSPAEQAYVDRVSAEVADTTAPVHVEGADASNPWPTEQTDFEDDARAWYERGCDVER